MKLNANLEGGQLSGRLSDRDEALRLLLLISGTLTERKQEVRLTGNVFDFDLAELGISPQKIGGSFALEAGASASDAGSYTARIALDSIEVRTRHRTDRIRPTSLSLSSDTTATRAKLASGDLSLAFVSRARGLAGSGPDAEHRHTRPTDTGTKRGHGGPETRIARFQPECHGRTRKYPE